MLPRRAVVAGAGALAGAGVLGRDAAAQTLPGYNILFILVDQEHYFETWPFPVPGREWLKRNGTTFTNHQAASCVCSPARSTIYNGAHIQHTGIFDNLNAHYQPDMSTSLRTIGHRMAQLGYYAAYQGKWHLSANLDVVDEAIEAPFEKYRSIIASYGFADFFGVGDISDRGLGGFTYDNATAAVATSWLRRKGRPLNDAGKPWYLALNFVNPHDVMYVNSDAPGETVQGARTSMPIFRPPHDEIYGASWDDVPLPSTRGQSFDAPNRPRGQAIYQQVQDILVGAWPDEDRRWRVLQNYYFNCIRDCDRQVVAILDALRDSELMENTIIVFNGDHGELGGHHQMRGKGNCTYRQQNHVPLMIVHPAHPGGQSCQAVTSQIDLAPTLLAMTGAQNQELASASSGLKGRDFSRLLAVPAAAAVDAARPAALFNYNMITFQDPAWMEQVRDDGNTKAEPDFRNRCAIRSVFDGRYRFSRYFSPIDFNQPTDWETLFAHNDVELYDLRSDPDEVVNLSADQGRFGDLVLAMNAMLNERIGEEVGTDDGSFLPIRDGKLVMAGASQR